MLEQVLLQVLVLLVLQWEKLERHSLGQQVMQ
jgi:hypothetical protein